MRIYISLIVFGKPWYTATIAHWHIRAQILLNGTKSRFTKNNAIVTSVQFDTKT